MNRVGRVSSITRNSAGGLIFAKTSGRFTNLLSTVSSVVFPHRLTGDSIPI
jgi:hypothetical protein